MVPTGEQGKQRSEALALDAAPVVDLGRRLQRLPGLLLRLPLGGQFAQLVVDQPQQPAGRVRVALTQSVQELGDVVHPVKGSAIRRNTGDRRWSINPARRLALRRRSLPVRLPDAG